jgi:hypothetical protein
VQQQPVLLQSPPTTPAELVCEPSMLTRSRRVLIGSVTQQQSTMIDSRECRRQTCYILCAAHLSPIVRNVAQTALKSIANHGQQAFVHSTPKAAADHNEANIIQRENNRKEIFVQ